MAKGPKYVVCSDDGCDLICEPWKGVANAKRLAAWVRERDLSCRPGGTREHVSRKLGISTRIYWANICEIATQKSVAEYKATRFKLYSQTPEQLAQYALEDEEEERRHFAWIDDMREQYELRMEKLNNQSNSPSP